CHIWRILTDGLDTETLYDKMFNKETTSENEGYRLVTIEGTDSLKSKLKTLILKYKDLFKDTLTPQPAKVKPLTLVVNEREWNTKKNQLAPRPQDKDKRKAVREFIEDALKNKLIEPSQAEYWSQIHLQKKPNGKWRFCIDFRNLNKVCEGMGWPIPNIEAMLHRIGGKRAKFFTIIDFTQGYYQTGLSKESRRFTAFRTETGLYQWTRVPMGLKGATSFFQSAMATVILSDLMFDTCEIYIDDLLQYGQDEKSYLDGLEKVLKRLMEYGVLLNPSKCKFGLTEVQYVGHVIDHEGLKFSSEKIEKVLNFELPKTMKNMKSFLGLTGFFRSHVANYAELSK
ncbi:RNA-directed DNA polymerase, partial [bacterium]|nr:RNA-directed DNA polymerase [Candidatus Elulimicrobium humile]